MALDENLATMYNTEVPFAETFCFFYGTLMDPATLGRVLKRPKSDISQDHKAVILGHGIKLWAEFPDLVDGPDDQIIHGVACKILSEEEEDRLAAYATDMYGAHGCMIDFENGSKPGCGMTFVWEADELLLQEGNFDLNDWLLRRKRATLGS